MHDYFVASVKKFNQSWDFQNVLYFQRCILYRLNTFIDVFYIDVILSEVYFIKSYTFQRCILYRINTFRDVFYIELILSEMYFI